MKINPKRFMNLGTCYLYLLCNISTHLFAGEAAALSGLSSFSSGNNGSSQNGSSNNNENSAEQQLQNLPSSVPAAAASASGSGEADAESLLQTYSAYINDPSYQQTVSIINQYASEYSSYIEALIETSYTTLQSILAHVLPVQDTSSAGIQKAESDIPTQSSTPTTQGSSQNSNEQSAEQALSNFSNN